MCRLWRGWEQNLQALASSYLTGYKTSVKTHFSDLFNSSLFSVIFARGFIALSLIHDVH